MEMHNKTKISLSVILFLMAGVCFLFLYRAVNLTWKVDEEGYYEISTPEEYRNFWRQAVYNRDIKGRLMKDITLNDLTDYENWRETPPQYLSPETECFTGVFDGNGHTIYGLYSENGYGLVKENAGEIRNLTIKDSLITGGYSEGGICYANYHKIINCRFEGTLLASGKDDGGRLAGVCIINYGFIEKCGFAGTMLTGNSFANSYSGDMAGICTENRYWIYGCYNLTVNQRPYYSNSYAVSDVKMENCYVRADGGWSIGADDHMIKLDEEQLYALPRLIEGDLGLLAQSSSLDADMEQGSGAWYNYRFQEVFADQIVSRLIRRLAEQGEISLSHIDICDLEENDEAGQGFHVKLAVGQGFAEVQACPVKDVIGDYEKLMEVCSGCLKETGQKGYFHETYQLTEAFERRDGGSRYPLAWEDAAALREPEMLVLYETETQRGFFYAAGEMLYRITSSDGSLQEKIVDGLCAGKEAGDGISWKEDWIRQAVYQQLREEGKGTRIFNEAEEEDPVFCREEIGELTCLTIQKAADIDSFEDFKYMPELSELYLNCFEETLEGETLGGKKGRLYLRFSESLPRLKSLTIEGAWIPKDHVDWETLSGIENLTFIMCRISDTDELRCLSKLKSLHISIYTEMDTSFLEDMPLLTELFLDECSISDLKDISRCKGLQSLSLSFNEIEDISGLVSLTKLEKLNLKFNQIQDIKELALLKKLKGLDLSYNNIQDYSPLFELQKLQKLYLAGNPGRNWGNLIFIPDMTAGGMYFPNQIERARQALEAIYPGQDITIEDVGTGDFNGDGMEDIAVVGGRLWSGNKDAAVCEKERKVYLLMGTEEGFCQVQTFYLPLPPDYDEEDGKYSLMCSAVLSDNHLIIQTYNAGNMRNMGGCFRITQIYIWDQDQMKPEYRNETEYDSEDR